MEPACPACLRLVRPRDFLCPNCRWQLQEQRLGFRALREAILAATPDPLGLRWAAAAGHPLVYVARCSPDGVIWVEERRRGRYGVQRQVVHPDALPGWAWWVPLPPWSDTSPRAIAPNAIPANTGEER